MLELAVAWIVFFAFAIGIVGAGFWFLRLYPQMDDATEHLRNVRQEQDEGAPTSGQNQQTKGANQEESRSEIRPVALLERDEVLERLAEAGVSLAVADREYEAGIEQIPYPRWSCWDLLNEPGLVRQLAYEFLDRFSEEMANTQISAVSFPAWRFLSGLEGELLSHGATILYVPSERQNNSRLVLFDLNINTGRTMAEAYDFYLEQGHRPSAMWVLLFNDFLPGELRPEMSRWVFKQLTQKGAENLEYLYRASEVAPCFKSEPLAMALQRIYNMLWSTRPSDWGQEERGAVKELWREREREQRRRQQRYAVTG